jgi:hypothetical protein
MKSVVSVMILISAFVFYTVIVALAGFALFYVHILNVGP